MTGPDSSQSSSSTPSGASEGRGGVWKRWWFWPLYAVLMIVLLCIAGYYYQRVRSLQGEKESFGLPDRFPVRRGYGRIGPSAPPPTTGPSEMTDNPLAGVAMTPLDEDPGGIVPPRGAVRGPAFVRRTGGEVEMMARYAWQGSAQRAAEYYKEYLIGKGMTFLGEQTRTGRSASTRPGSSMNARPRRIFVFHGLGRQVTVTLREMSGNDKALSITLNLVHLDS